VYKCLKQTICACERKPEYMFCRVTLFLLEKQFAKKQHRNDPCLKTFEIIQYVLTCKYILGIGESFFISILQVSSEIYHIIKKI